MTESFYVFDSGFKLPVYETLDVTWGTMSAQKMSEISGFSFVRQTVLRAAGLEIDEALRVADQAFNEVTSSCGAVVLPHRWGIARMQTSDRHIPNQRPSEILGSRSDTPQLPRGFSLVAEVPVVYDVTEPDESDEDSILNAIDRHGVIHGSQKYWWKDGGPVQFGRGTIAGNDTADLVALDIEPRLINVTRMTKIPKPTTI